MASKNLSGVQTRNDLAPVLGRAVKGRNMTGLGR